MNGKFRTALAKLKGSGPQYDFEKALIHYELGHHQQAHKMLLDFKRKYLGGWNAKDPTTQTILYHMGRVSLAMGNLHLTEFAWGRAANTLEKHPDSRAALICANQSLLFSLQGDFDEAAIWSTRSLVHLKQAMSDSSRILAYQQLGAYYEQINDLSKATIFFNKAVKLASQVYGARHYQTTTQKLHQARIYLKTRQYVTASIKYSELTTVFNNILESEHIIHADIAHARAELALASKLYNEAHQYAKTAQRIRQNQRGAEHFIQGETLLLIARIQEKDNLFSEGIIQAEAAIQFYTDHFPDNELMLAYALSRKASLLLRQGESADALKYFSQARTILTNYLGESMATLVLESEGYLMKDLSPNQPLADLRKKWEQIRHLKDDHAKALAEQNLAEALLREKKLEEAKDHFISVIKRQEHVLFSNNRAVAYNLGQLSLCHARLKNWTALTKSMQRLQVVETQALQEMLFSDERDQLAYATEIQRRYQRLLFHMLEGFRDHPSLVREGLELALRRKGLVFDLAIQRQRFLTNLDKDDDRDNQKLKQIDESISKWKLRLASETFHPGAPQQLSKLQNERRSLQQQLRYLLKRTPIWQIQTQTLRETLPNDRTLMCFVIYGESEKFYGLFSVSNGEVKFSKLGSKSDLDNKIKSYRRAITDLDFERYIALGTKLFAYLPPLNDFDSRLIIMPEGDFHHFPIESLPLSSKKFLVEEFSCTYVTSARAFSEPANRRTGSRMFVFADPDFGKMKNKGDWPKLEVSAQEAQTISSVMGSDIRIFSGKQANKSNLISSSPGILHIATHGRFQKSLEASKFFNSWNDPTTLVRSGLVMAGINNPEMDPADCILTAQEAIHLSLDKTQLVFLSICHSNRGVVIEGEGVYGIKRAFQIAGARNIVSSLWATADKSYIELIRTFYQNYLLKPDERALANAIRKKIQALRDQGKEPMPFIWSNFIYSGL